MICRPLKKVAIVTLVLAACNEREGADDTIPTQSVSLELAIGAMDGDGADVFGSIGGLTVDQEGRIVVADAQSHEIRVFDVDGAFLFFFGRKGGGPGELDGPCCLAFDPEGNLWVRDTNNARYNRYRLESDGATYLGQHRMQHGASGFWNPLTFDPSGNLVDVGMAPGSSGPEVVRYHLDTASAVVSSVQIRQPSRDSVGEAVVPVEFPGGRRGVRYYQQPFGPQHRIAHAPGGDWAKVLTSVYAIEWYDATNTLLRVVTRDVSAVPVSQTERDSTTAQLAENLRRDRLRMSDLPWGIPDVKPPVRSISFDQLGRLWVERFVAEGSARQVDVFERDGALVFSVELPKDVRLFPVFIDEEAIVAVQLDDVGVQRVVRLSFGHQAGS